MSVAHEANEADGRVELTFRDALRRLSSAQKSGAGAPAYSRWVNRRMGRVAAAAAYVAGLTPNAVTCISVALSYTAVVVLAACEPTAIVGASVAVLLIGGHALDAADGQLARLRGGGSVAGEWLDHMFDCVKLSALHVAVAISVYRSAEVGNGWALVPLAWTVVAATLFFAQIFNEQLLQNHGVEQRTGPDPAPDGFMASGVYSVLKLPVDYGVLCLSFFVLGSTRAFLALYATMFAVSAAYLLAGWCKWFRTMVAVDRAAG